MKVLKFGGTSVGSVNSMLNVKKIVEAIPPHRNGIYGDSRGREARVAS